MTTSTKISIITVSLNAELTIEDTINSVLLQDYPNIEYIIVDGASTDNTLLVIDKFKDSISKIISEPDDGIFHAMNKGIRAAGGEYIYFLNCGDRLVSNNTISKFFSLPVDQDILFGDLIVESKLLGLIRKSYPAQLNDTFFMVDALPHQAQFTKRILFEKLNYFDPEFKFAGDFEFSLRAIYKEACSYKYLRIPIAFYNLQGVSASSQNRNEFYWERKIAQINNLPNFRKIYRNYSYYLLKDKLFPTLVFFIKSKLSKKFLYD